MNKNTTTKQEKISHILKKLWESNRGQYVLSSMNGLIISSCDNTHTTEGEQIAAFFTNAFLVTKSALSYISEEDKNSEDILIANYHNVTAITMRIDHNSLIIGIFKENQEHIGLNLISMKKACEKLKTILE